jgi:hypothetical protein
MVGAPGHGKDVVDALNTTTKSYLKQKMQIVSCPGHDKSDGKMKGQIKTTSFARECLWLCNLSDRKDGVKSFAKYGKREILSSRKKGCLVQPTQIVHNWPSQRGSTYTLLYC